MRAAEFFEYNDDCPICGGPLSKEAQVDVLVDKPNDQNGFALAGSVFYSFDGKKFIKNPNKISRLKSHKEMMDIIHREFPNSFEPRKKFHVRVNKKNLSKLTSPSYVHSFDTRLVRMCSVGKHLYYYESQYMFEDEAANDVEIELEVIDVQDFRIYNKFTNGVPSSTEVADKKKYKDAPTNMYLYGLHSLPYIPASKWETKTSDALRSQIEKYLLLR